MILRAGGLALAVSLVVAAWFGACEQATPARAPGRAAGRAAGGGTPRAAGQPAWSAQLHLHGSFSEGVGSIDGHAAQAEALGVDVLWWSDHDYNVGSYRLVSTFGFEGPEEAIDQGESWTRRLRREDDYRKTLAPSALSSGEGQYAFTEDGLEGGRCLRVESQPRQGRFRSFLLEWATRRGLQRRTLATGVRIELAVFPERLGPDARAVLHLELSEHAPHFEQHALRYYLGQPGEEPQLEGTTYRVPLTYRAGRWNEYELDPGADVQRGFPDLPAGDNLIFQLALGVESRSGAEAVARFDRLRLSSRRVGGEGLAAQRELLAELAPSTPELRHLQGLEISYEAYHLNEFSLETPLPDYELLVRESGLAGFDGRIEDARALREYVSRRAVEAAHARGGLISYNHLFGAALEGSAGAGRDRSEVLEQLIEEAVYGADLLEVGYRDRGGHSLEDHLWAWDGLAQAGLRLVGTGVSDYHGGGGADAWRRMENNFVSWIYAARPAKAELIEGLRAGRVFFGDIARFDGLVDLETPEGFRMGEVVLTDRPDQAVTARITGLAGGERLRLVGAGGTLAEGRARGGEDKLEASFALPADGHGFARLEVRAADGAAVVFSNPVWFLRADDPSRAAVARGRLDVAGVRDVERHGVELIAARALDAEAGIELELEAVAPGVLTLDLGPGRGVRELVGLEGQTRAEVRW